MILGLGIDIIEVERIREVWKRHGERFARRILRDSELAYCLAHSDPAPCLAVRPILTTGEDEPTGVAANRLRGARTGP